MKFICIEGNIGSGKTSLAAKLAGHLEAKLIREEFEDNPFLPLFYKTPQQFAFPLEFSFLIDRARQLNRLATEIQQKLHVADYYIEKCLWFAEQNLNPEQLFHFKNTYPHVKQIAPVPDLLVFLHLPEEMILENISKRGRDFEKTIDPVYLRGMNLVYKQQSGLVNDVKSVINFNMSSNSSGAYEKVFRHLLQFIENGGKQPAKRLDFDI